MEKLEKLLEEKFEKEGKKLRRGYFVKILDKNYFDIYFRYVPHFGGSRRISYYIEVKRKYAYIEKIYVGTNGPYQNYGRIKVAKEEIIDIIKNSRNAEELYDKIERLFEFVAFGIILDDVEG